MGADGQPTGYSVWQVDFTPFSTPGTYRLYVPAWNAQSYDFELEPNVYDEVGKAALKTFYYQRCGVAHSQPYAQAPWSDPRVCHRYLTATTAATGEPDYGPLDLSGGWHDAGDYNKYVWADLFLAANSLMTAYESHPGVWGDGQLLVPGGGNGVPDIVDEVKVEIDWLLKMQLANGDVLSRVWDGAAGAPDSSPPSNAIHDHHYYGPTLEATERLHRQRRPLCADHFGARRPLRQRGGARAGRASELEQPPGAERGRQRMGRRLEARGRRRKCGAWTRP